MIVGIIFAGLFFIAAIFISIHKMLELRKIKSMHAWTKVTGKVLSNDQSRESDGDGGFCQMQTLGYAYSIGKQEYTAVVTWVADNNAANIKFTKHVAGQRVDVLYNPENKEESVLEKFDQKKVFNSMFFAILFVIMGMACIGFGSYDE